MCAFTSVLFGAFALETGVFSNSVFFFFCISTQFPDWGGLTQMKIKLEVVLLFFLKSNTTQLHSNKPVFITVNELLCTLHDKSEILIIPHKMNHGLTCKEFAIEVVIPVFVQGEHVYSWKKHPYTNNEPHERLILCLSEKWLTNLEMK